MVPEFFEKPEDIVVNNGGEIKLCARVRGKPLPKVSWLLGSKLLLKSNRVEMRENNGVQELVVRSATLDDEGMYRCIAVNKFGEANCDCEVMVEGTFF